MTYPRRHLVEGESIIDERGVHFIKLVPSVFSLLVVFAGLGAGFVLWKNAPVWFGIFLGAMFLSSIAFLLVKILIFRSTRVILTSRRLIYRTGIFRKVSRDIPLGSIVDLSSHQSFLRRIVGLGEVELKINAQDRPMVLHELSHPKELVALVRGAAEEFERARVRSFIAEGQPVNPESEHRRMISLHRKGVITEQELADHERAFGIISGDKDGLSDES